MFNFAEFGETLSLANDREDLGHRLADKIMEKRRDAKNRTLGMARKSAFGETPNRIKRAMGKTPDIKSPALNVSYNVFLLMLSTR